MNSKSLFLRKLTTDPAEAEGHGSGLKRSLGALDLTLLGIGAIIGAGLFSSIQDMIGGTFDPVDHSIKTLGAGPAVMISFALTALACGFAALCYAEISAMVPVSGSAYSYSYAAFGEMIAWIIGWDLIIEYAIGNVYVAQKWGAYFQTFLKGMFDWHFPLWLSVDAQTASGMAHSAANESWTIWKPVLGIADGASFDPAGYFPSIAGHAIGINFPAFLITMLITTLLFVGIKESARANAVMVVLKVGLVITFIGCGFWTIVKKGESHWTPFMPNGFTGVWHGAAIGFFSYIGFDAVSTAGEETRNPQRDMPRGLLWSLGICTVLYILTAVALTGVVDYNTIKTDDPLAAAMTRMGFDKFATVFAFGAVIAMTAVLLVFQLGQTRIFMVMSRDGLLPPVFSRIHPRFKTPHVSTWVTGVIVALACSILTPDQAIGLTNIGTLFAFILVSIGVIVLRRRHPDAKRPFKVPLYPVTPILSALACLALICGLERSNWLRLVIWLAIGLVVYFTYGYSHSVLRRKSSAKAGG
jgi:APA family basic amino acid/polyamine antiporter